VQEVWCSLGNQHSGGRTAFDWFCTWQCCKASGFPTGTKWGFVSTAVIITGTSSAWFDVIANTAASWVYGQLFTFATLKREQAVAFPARVQQFY